MRNSQTFTRSRFKIYTDEWWSTLADAWVTMIRVIYYNKPIIIQCIEPREITDTVLDEYIALARKHLSDVNLPLVLKH